MLRLAKLMPERTEEKSMSTFRSTGIALAACLLLGGSSFAQEKKIKRSELPPAVEKQVAEVSKGASIKGFTEEKENGKTSYEVAMEVNGHSKDVEMDKNGTILEVEEEIAMESVPADAREGLTAKAGGGKIVKVESLMKKGKIVAYEAKVMTAGKKTEIQVGPDGKPLGHEE
jgi:hypothetical protein